MSGRPLFRIMWVIRRGRDECERSNAWAVRQDDTVTPNDSAAAGTWTTRDAWLLLSIGDHGRHGCRLSSVLGSADARKHDIPTESECASIIGTLIASGLVEMKDDHYRVTPTGKEIVKLASGEFFLQSRTVLPPLAENRRVEGKVAFADDEFDEAYQAYRQRTGL